MFLCEIQKFRIKLLIFVSRHKKLIWNEWGTWYISISCSLLKFILRRCWTEWLVFVISELGMWRQEDHWSSLISHLKILLYMLQHKSRSCHHRTYAVPKKQTMISSDFHMHAHICPHVLPHKFLHNNTHMLWEILQSIPLRYHPTSVWSLMLYMQP